MVWTNRMHTLYIVEGEKPICPECKPQPKLEWYHSCYYKCPYCKRKYRIRYKLPSKSRPSGADNSC